MWLAITILLRWGESGSRYSFWRRFAILFNPKGVRLGRTAGADGRMSLEGAPRAQGRLDKPLHAHKDILFLQTKKNDFKKLKAILI